MMRQKRQSLQTKGGMRPAAEAAEAVTGAGEAGLRTGRPKKKKGSPVKQALQMLLLKIGMILLFFFILLTFFFGITQQPDNSMSPAVKEGDLVIYYRMQRDYLQNDPVVVKNDGILSVRRVVAVPGDEVKITDQGLVLNGYPQQEKDIYSETLPFVGGTEYPVTLGSGQYFVLGDNREEAEDSRAYGAVDDSAVKGGVMTVIRRRNF